MLKGLAIPPSNSSPINTGVKSQKPTIFGLTNIVGLVVFFLAWYISCSKHFINANTFNSIVKYERSVHDLVSSEKKLVKAEMP